MFLKYKVNKNVNLQDLKYAESDM